MKNKHLKQIISVLVAGVMAFSVAACGSDSGKQADKEKKEKVIHAATTDEDMEEMLLTTKDALKKAGYKLEVKMFSGDYVAPNLETEDGKIDVNFFQHVPYLEEFNQDHKTHLEAAGKSIFYSTMGLFSHKIDSLDQIEDGMTIALSSDITNKTRALRFMESMDLIKLKKGLNVYNITDIEENPHNLDIVELDYAMIPKAFEDVDMLIIYPYDMELAGYDVKPIVQDPPAVGSEYGIVLVTNEKNHDAKWLKIMQEEMEKDACKDVVYKYYKDTGVHVSDY